MTPIQLALLIFGVMLLLMVVRVPIAGAMFTAGAVGFVLQSGLSPFLNFVNNLAFARLANYDLSVIPLFILMGHFATQGGISKALFQFAAAVMGRFKGGLAMGAVLACGACGIEPTTVVDLAAQPAVIVRQGRGSVAPFGL